MARRTTAKKTDYAKLASGTLKKATSFFSSPAYATAAKPAKKAKVVTAAMKKAAPKKPYRALVTEAIRATAKPVKGSSLLAIVTYLEKTYPGKSDRFAIRTALRSGVIAGVFKKTKASYRVVGSGKKKKSKSASTATASTSSKKPAAAKKSASSSSSKKSAAAPKKRAAAAAPKKAAATPVKRAAAAVKKARATTGAARVAATPAPALVKRASSLKTGKAKVFDSSTAAPEVAGVSWEYDHAGWKAYDKAASDVVEAAYQEWRKNPYTDVRAIKSGQWEYNVDFTNMLQTNIQHENHTQRKIRRRAGGGQE